MGQTITWIGWEINLSSACFSLPEAKRNKLHELVSECLRHRQVSRKQLDKLLGLLQWILHGMPTLRPWLSSLYDDMHRPLGTNVSINPTSWMGIGSHLDEELRFTTSPPGTAISTGAKLLSARHVDLNTKADLVKVPVSTKRIWMRVADPTSSRRKLCPDSVDVLRFFQHLSSVEWRPRPLRPPALIWWRPLLTLLARETTVALAAGCDSQVAAPSGFPSFSRCNNLQLWVFLFRAMPTLTFPATKPWHNALFCSLSGSAQEPVAWL